MRTTNYILLLLFISNLILAQGNIKITVKDIEVDKGQVMISLYNSDDSFLKHPYKVEKKDADSNSLTFDFADLPKGFYAISIYQDRNEDLELNIGRFGPKEPFGISNYSEIKYEKAKFIEAKFEVNDNNTTPLHIKLD
jgi:uncharacterized protein (DUF2141 family)